MFIGHADLTNFNPGPDEFSSPTCQKLEWRIWEILRQNITWRGDIGYILEHSAEPYLLLKQGLLSLSGAVVESVVLAKFNNTMNLQPNISVLLGASSNFQYLACAPVEHGIYPVRRLLTPDNFPEFGRLETGLHQIFSPYM